MSHQGVPELAIGQVPDLDGSIPRSRYNGGLQIVGTKPHAADPISMGVALLNRVLALS